MFRTPTTIIVGAGASADYRFPLGSGLRTKIADLINIGFEDFGSSLQSGDHIIVECLREVSRQIGQNGNINNFINSARSMAAAMPLALSIDNYLDAHKDDPNTIICGKLAIARAILMAEKESSLWFDHRHADSFNLTTVEKTWLARFVNALTEGVSTSNLDKIFENVTIISFNYDRCIKHFLQNALKTYYRLDDEYATDLLKTLRIYHPYGSTGELPWEEQNGVRFGSDQLHGRLLQIAYKIKTFTEQIEDETLVAQMRSSTQTAGHIIFLGFGFHRQNIELVSAERPRSCQRIFATAMNISISDKAVIENALRGAFEPEYRSIDIKMHDGDCPSLFDNYWRSITS
jgi:SIR2-like domain